MHGNHLPKRYPNLNHITANIEVVQECLQDLLVVHN